MNVKLCINCVYDLKEYNPYIVNINIKEVKTIEECDNYCDKNGILNSEKIQENIQENIQDNTI